MYKHKQILRNKNIIDLSLMIQKASIIALWNTIQIKRIANNYPLPSSYFKNGSMTLTNVRRVS